MKCRLLIFLFLSFSLSAEFSAAETYRRLVNFEWEAIEDARSYEIELQQVKTQGEGKTFTFKTDKSAWNGRLAPGKYMLRIRSRDYRDVPGEWANPSEFNVGLEPAVLTSPQANAKIASKEDTQTEIKFAWNPVGGADEYHFELLSEDGKTLRSETVKETSIKLQVPVAAHYTWKVSSANLEGTQSDATTISQLTVLGKGLDTPKLQKPESEFVREIKWQRPGNTSQFDVIVYRYSPEKKKLEKFKVFENYKDDSLSFDPAWPGGKYAVAVRAKADLRPTSGVARESFKVRSGDRSPAAEYTALVRGSIERMSGWYAIASYLVTEMKFSGSNPEKNSTVAYSALGGTTRVGLGWFNINSPWGFLGIVDLSGFTLKGKIRTFASTELNAVYRKPLGDRAEARFQVGAYYKELPETIGDPFSNSSEDQMISAAGPHAGAEYWYSITPKFGIQINAHLYTALMKVSTPNGQPLSPSLSTQFGFLGSYRFTPTLTGLAGYARREDKLSYKAVPSASNFASDGDVNQSTVIGNYLNLFAEWSF